MTFKQKFSLRFLLIIGLLFTINTEYNVVDLLVVAFMFIGLIIDFIQIEKSVRETLSSLLFWFICIIIVFHWKNLPLFSFQIFYIELFKIFVIILIWFATKSNIPQNTIIGKLWIIGLFIYVGEISVNSTFGFYGLYVIITILSLLYIIFKAVRLTRDKNKTR